MVNKFKQLIFKNKFTVSNDLNIAKIYIKSTYSNIFITLTDISDKVIICCTSGSSGLKGSKHRKKAPQAVETIMKKIYPFLSLHRIKLIEVIVKSRINSSIYILVKELLYYGLTIVSFKERKTLAHNGTRPRKLRRT
jgi:ribosomal protein S11